MSKPVLTIGIPSKGRLQENAFAFFSRAGLNIVQPRGARDYRGTVKGIEGIEIAFLSASEIAGELARGAVHFGVTGADLIHESLADPASKVEMLAPLGFGFANVVVAVPEAWIDVHEMADIEEVAADFRHKQARRLRERLVRSVGEGLVNPAVNDLHLVPLAAIKPAQQLAAAE